MYMLTSLESTILLLGVVLVVLWWMSTRRPPGLPPGPGPALPLLGHLHLLAKDPRLQFWKWRRQYGEVFSLYMGPRLVVVLASYSAIREAFITFADAFSNRPILFATEKTTKKKASPVPLWKEQRKTSQEILRQMGMGKNVLAEKIQKEITQYIREIRDHQGAPVSLARMTHVSVSNNICSIVFGKRFDYHDPEFLNYLERLQRNFKLLGGMALLNYFPLLAYLPGDPFRGQECLDNSEHIMCFVDRQMTEHQTAQQLSKGEMLSPDFIHSYLHHINSLRTNGNSTSADEENLPKIVLGLFVGATETTTTVILWALLFFLHYPHVQDRCFQEISDVIGTDRMPSMSDKVKLPYVEATVREVLRKGDIGPLNMPHVANQDVTFREHVIPKGTIIIPALMFAHGDPEIWGDPDNFRPERFLDEEGKLTRADELIPFSIGRRACLGESMARMELFLYLTTLIQHFRFLPPEEGQLPSLDGVFGQTVTPQPFKIRAVPRM